MCCCDLCAAHLRRPLLVLRVATGAEGRSVVQQRRCRSRGWTSTAVLLSGRFKTRAMLLTFAYCELGGDAVENSKPASAARGPRAPTPTTAAIAILHMRLMMLMI